MGQEFGKSGVLKIVTCTPVYQLNTSARFNLYLRSINFVHNFRLPR